ncbi:MAG TPA: sugar kinase [Candidatus Altiarchaeales archaeon]|nr:sugar kinase [Candidatus Altiarchaeales archaeon]
MNLMTVGTLALDDIKTPFGEVKGALGGSATYFGLAASFFTECGLIGVVGSDFPEEHLDFLKSKKLDLSGIEAASGKTFRWSGSYEFDMNQAHTLKTELNVLSEFNPKIPGGFRNCEILFLANIDPDLQLEVLEKVKPKYCFADTMNFWIEGNRESLDEVFGRVDGIIINDSEARQYCKTPNLIACGKILSRLNDGKVIIKKGEHGILYFSEERFFSLPAYPVENLVDPTGAGDSFAGGTLGHLAKHGEFSDEMMRKSIVCGSTVASYVVSGFSVDGIKVRTHEDIESRYQHFRNIVAFDHNL